MEIKDDGAFRHDEADVTMVSYVIQAANYGKNVIRVLSDDTDVFVLLMVYWVYKAALQCKVQMERCNGTVLDINATCTELGPKSLQLLGMHALSGWIPPHIYMAKARQEHSTPCFLGTFLVWQMPWVRLTSHQLI